MRDGGRPAPGTKAPPCGWGTEGFPDDFPPLLRLVMAMSLEDQVTVRPVSVLPAASFRMAVNC